MAKTSNFAMFTFSSTVVFQFSSTVVFQFPSSQSSFLMTSRRLIVLYGSETGTAQDLAEQIWRESKLLHFSGTTLSMDDFDPTKLIDERLVIFVVSTTGQGEEPTNMRRFWKFLLKKTLPVDSLGSLYFAVLALGDSSYVKFNFVGKRLNKRLQQLGARPVIPIGLCDDQHDMGAAAVYLPWLKELWTRVEELFPLSNGLQKLEVSPRQFKWEIQTVEGEPDVVQLRFNDPKARELRVVENRRTTSLDHFQDVRLISFDADGLEWSPGDVACVRPENSDASVAQLFQLLEESGLSFTPKTVIQLKEIDSELPVPEFLKQRRMTLDLLAKQYWNLNAIPRPRTFELLALNCTNELEKEKLLELASPEGQEDLFSYANRPRRTTLEVLYDFPHATATLDLQTLFEVFQSIKPRSFSIASSFKTGKLDLLVAVVEYKTKLVEHRKGLCSNWLKSLDIGQQIPIFIKKGTFKVPPVDIPLIMVGPGTGLAPFRSILQERELSESGSSVLFFGCRGEAKDFHCKDDLNRLEAKGFLKLICAFSRDQEDKVYVQHKIQENAELVKETIKIQNGAILIAGNSKNMPQAVQSAFKDVLDAPYVDEMIKTGRYQEETWS